MGLGLKNAAADNGDGCDDGVVASALEQASAIAAQIAAVESRDFKMVSGSGGL
jgi:hypothetical protein